MGPREPVQLGLAFVAVHLGCLLIPLVGWSPFALALALATYLVRGFAITAVFHRLLAHRAFTTSRRTQTVGAAIATSAGQRGPLWWVGHHRRHHRFADRPGDPHSPGLLGLRRAHVGWQFQAENRTPRLEEVEDLAALRELQLLDRYHYVAPVTLALMVALIGALVGRIAPSWGTNGTQALAWGFFVSTVALYHATFSVNSLGHRVGRRRFETRDTSRNNRFVALIALGEGWHNNHHRFPGSARHGFRRSELDATHALLRALARLGLVADLRPVPAHLWAGDARHPPKGSSAAARPARELD